MHARAVSRKRKLVLKIGAIVLAAAFIFSLVLILAPSDNIWLETKRELEARGEVLDWEKFIPPAIPAEQNLFEHPVAASLLPLRNQPTPSNPLDVPTPAFPTNCASLGLPFDMTRLAEIPREPPENNNLSLRGLHDWFAQWDESFAQLREAGKRPRVRLPGDYTSPSGVPIPNFVAARNLAQVLASRARVHLLLGDAPSALEDLESLVVLMKSFEAQPGTLVMAMIHVAICGLYLETIEDGLRRHLWSEPQLRAIISQLTALNLLNVVEQGIRAERAGVTRHLTALAERKRDPLYRSTLDIFPSSGWTVQRIAIHFSPASWIRRNQAQYARIVQEYLDAIDLSERRIDHEQLDRVYASITKVLQSNWKNAIFAYVTPSFSKAAATVARNQARADQLALACALELFRSRNASYPAELHELIPDFIQAIPKDIYAGEPVIYSRTADGYDISAPNSAHTATPTFIWKTK